jgi:WXG100 family type VII secretion target
VSDLIHEAGSVSHGAGKVLQTHDDVERDLGKLRNVIDDLVANAWGGSASQAFHQVMGEWDTSAKRLLVAMGNIGDLLDRTGKEFTMTDDMQKNMVMQTKDYGGKLGERL